MFKKISCLFLALLMVASLCSCSFGGLIKPSGGNQGGNSNNNNNNSNGKLADGKWPASIYSQYGIDEIKTNGKIVYTEFSDDDSYQYRVYYKDVTRDELVSWTNSLFDKGLRASDKDKNRLLNSTYEYDIMIYGKEEKQPYRMRIGFDFGHDMEFEYYSYWDDNNPNYIVVEEKDEYGEDHAYIRYNMTVSLNPMNNTEEYEGEFASLGLKAEDLKGIPNVRKVDMGEAIFMSSISFIFYTDHIATDDEIKACRELLIDKLAEKGAKFYELSDTEKEISASELKDSGSLPGYVENNGAKFLIMKDPDSKSGDFGSYYGIILTKTN